MQELLELPIPNMRASYKIGQAAEVLGIKPFVLRYWETEFPCLVPKRTPKGQRYYTEPDLALIRRIRDLLYVEKLTIEGARQALERESERRDLDEARRRAEAAEARAEAALAAVQSAAAPETGPDAVPDAAHEAGSAERTELLREVAAELAEIRRMLERS